MNGVTFDAGGLIALERSDRRVLALVATALEGGDRIVVPATALARIIRNPAKQVRLWRLIQSDLTEIEPLDGGDAQAAGALLARSGTADMPMRTSSSAHRKPTCGNHKWSARSAAP